MTRTADNFASLEPEQSQMNTNERINEQMSTDMRGQFSELGLSDETKISKPAEPFICKLVNANKIFLQFAIHSRFFGTFYNSSNKYHAFVFCLLKYFG